MADAPVKVATRLENSADQLLKAGAPTLPPANAAASNATAVPTVPVSSAADLTNSSVPSRDSFKMGELSAKAESLSSSQNLNAVLRVERAPTRAQLSASTSAESSNAVTVGNSRAPGSTILDRVMNWIAGQLSRIVAQLLTKPAANTNLPKSGQMLQQGRQLRRKKSVHDFGAFAEPVAATENSIREVQGEYLASPELVQAARLGLDVSTLINPRNHESLSFNPKTQLAQDGPVIGTKLPPKLQDAED